MGFGEYKHTAVLIYLKANDCCGQDAPSWAMIVAISGFTNLMRWKPESITPRLTSASDLNKVRARMGPDFSDLPRLDCERFVAPKNKQLATCVVVQLDEDALTATRYENRRQRRGK